MRIAKTIGIVILILILLYWMGPKPSLPKYGKELPEVPEEPALLENYIYNKESRHKVKPDNESKIIWYNDSLKNKTEFAVVYLHGFSASSKEGDPVHINFAKRYGCNLYLPRLADHGIDTTEPMAAFTADRIWNSAKEAYEIGRQLGKKIIILSTSTGGTLALKLAAEYPDIAALILLSPNIEINDPNAWLLNNPWGLQIAHLVKGNYNTSSDTTATYKKYWYHKYRMEAAVQLEELVETTMRPATFKKVTQPLLLLYYYKDEEHQDDVVKVKAMQHMFKELGTVAEQKRAIAVPEAGDHVIGSSIKSKDYKTVENACEKFAEEILHLKPI